MMRRLTDVDYRIDAVTAAKALLGAWLCRRLDDGTVIRHRLRLPARPAPQMAIYGHSIIFLLRRQKLPAGFPNLV